jgi:hypothetical protein
MKYMVLITLISSSAFATEESSISTRQVETASVTAGIGVGTGVISYKQFSTANKARAAGTETIHGSVIGLSSVGEPKVFNDSELKSMQSRFQASDEIELTHYLNDEKNKELHLTNKKDEIRSHLSDSSHYRTQADLALIPKTEMQTYIENGRSKTRMVMKGPDWSSHVLYNSMADNAQREAELATNELATMKTQAASSFPKINLTEVVKSSPNSVETALNKMKAFGSDGGKIVKVTRLSESAVKEIAKKNMVGGIAAAASVASLVASLEEVVVGKIAQTTQGGSKRLGNDSGSNNGWQ